MHLSENEGIEGKVFVVTGGVGCVGSALCLELLRRGAHQVRSLDLRPHSPCSSLLHSNPSFRAFQGDVRRKEDVEKCLRGADCVFHLASYGMSGKEMLQMWLVDDININGTCCVLDACLVLGVERLVYVSTYNVVFGGQQIVNGNEALPYFPLDDHVDSYGRSKSIAEQLVLKSNGRLSKKKNGCCLYTCSIRPAAIYGPGEERHLPRIISMAKKGLLFFRIGDENVKSDWVYVDNLVTALLLASMGLLKEKPHKHKQPIAAGQAYFISDGSPINTFEFLKPILGNLDYHVPRTTITVPTALFLAKTINFLYTVMYPWLKHSWLPQPLILPAEVYKVGVTHYFSFLKAKEELGHIPMVSPCDGLAATISYWKDKQKQMFDGPGFFPWIVFLGLTLTFYAAYLPPIAPLSWVNLGVILVFRSITIARAFCITISVAHVAEGFYAWHLAKKVDPSNSKRWFWQTLALGMLSLRFLLNGAGNVHRDGTATTISHQQDKKQMIDGPGFFTWFFVLLGLTLTFYAVYLPPIAALHWVNPFVILVFRSLTVAKVFCITALVTHIVEGFYAWHLAKEVDPSNSKRWFWQTLALGIFSLRFLLKGAGYASRDGLAAAISGQDKKQMVDGPGFLTWFLVLLGMGLTFYAAYLPPVAPLHWVNFLSVLMLRSLTGVRVCFIMASVMHIVEGFYAWHLAKKVDPSNSKRWFWQTLALGIFSLRFLLKCSGNKLDQSVKKSL